MSELQEVLRRLPLLSKTDLVQVRQRVQFLGGSLLNTASKNASEEAWLLESMAAELQRRGVLVGKIARQRVPQDFPEKSVYIQQHLLKGAGDKKLSRTERLSLGQTATSVLCDFLQSARVPLSVKVVLTNADKIPQAMEAAFPGYWQNSKLHFLFSGHREGMRA